jgi:sulfoxide reductase heme-binding subunit YedZ
VSDAVFFTGLAAWLVLWRLAPKRWQGRLLLLPALAVFAAATAAGLEAAWYGLKTGANAQRVLAANLDVTFGLRPAVQAGAWGMAVFVAALLRRGWTRLIGARMSKKGRPGLCPGPAGA